MAFNLHGRSFLRELDFTPKHTIKAIMVATLGASCAS